MKFNWNKTDLYLELQVFWNCSYRSCTSHSGDEHPASCRSVEEASRNSTWIEGFFSQCLPTRARVVPSHLSQCGHLFPGQIKRCSDVWRRLLRTHRRNARCRGAGKVNTYTPDSAWTRPAPPRPAGLSRCILPIGINTGKLSTLGHYNFIVGYYNFIGAQFAQVWH